MERGKRISNTMERSRKIQLTSLRNMIASHMKSSIYFEQLSH